MARNKGLSWSQEQYIPVASIMLRKHTEKELREEYTRLRDIAQKRLKRIGQSEFAESQTYKNFAGVFKTTRSIKDKDQLAMALADVASFVGTEMTLSKMKKQRSESLKTLKEHGYNFVNEKNYVKFGRFMQTYKNANLDKIYDSARAVAIFQARPERKNISPSRLKELFEADERRGEVDGL